MTISRARCTNHGTRQASGICPSCSRPFCRECLTEHAGRLTCASCLRRAEPVEQLKSRWKRAITTPAMLVGALLASWFIFYLLGTSLEKMSAPARPTAARGVRL